MPSLASQTLYLTATLGSGQMHAPISFSPPESGGTYFACIAYVEGVVFQWMCNFAVHSFAFCAEPS